MNKPDESRFDRNNPDAYWQAIVDSGEPLLHHIEGLLVVSRFTQTPSVKASIDAFFDSEVEKDIKKAYRSRTKFHYTGSLKDADKNIMALASLGKVSPSLDLGKILSILSYNGLVISKESFLNKEPQWIGRLNGVKSLYISYAFPNGLPEEIGALESLEEFTLNSSTIEELPKSFGNLKNLRSIALDVYTLKEIPSCLLEMPYLESLSIQGARYDYIKTAFKIPEWLGRLQALKSLELFYLQEETLPENCIPKNLERFKMAQQPKLRKIPDSLASCSHLKEIWLATCDNVEALPEGLVNLNELMSIELINMKGLKKLNGDLLYGPNIQKLKLAGVEAEISNPTERVHNWEELTIQNEQYLGYVLEHPHLFPQLKTLNLYSIDKISNNALRFAALGQLEHLYLNQFPPVTELLEGIGQCKSLKQLRFCNWLGTELDASLAMLPSLEVLELLNCDKLELHMKDLPAKMGSVRLSSLKAVHLDMEKPLSIHTLSIGMSPILGMENLRSLDLVVADLSLDRKVDGKAILKKMPSLKGQMPSLRSFKLVGKVEEFSDCFEGLNQLESLDIQGFDVGDKPCPIKTIAIDLAQLPSLKRLSIHAYAGNALDRILSQACPELESLELDGISSLKYLPPLSHFKKLTSLTIRDCDQFVSLKNDLPALRYLRISYCKNVSGDILEEISQMTSLKTLYLERLSKAINVLPREWSFLEKLVLDHLEIKKIPAYISEFVHLHSLGLDGLFLGTLPKEMAALQNLRELSICMTYLTSMPAELASLQLEKLYMTMLKFSGYNIKKEVYEVLMNRRTELITSRETI